MSAPPMTGLLTVGVMTSQSGAPMTEALSGTDGLLVQRIERPSELHRFIRDLDVLLVSNDFYQAGVAELVRKASRLRYLHFVSSGFDNLRLHGAPHHLALSRGGQSHSSTVAEHAVTLLLGLVRRLPELERNRLAALWDRDGLRKTLASIEGKTVLIVGFGAIGQQVARRLGPFDARVVGVMRSAPEPEVAALAERIVQPDALHGELAEADAVILSLPLSIETKKFIGARELAAMKPSAYLVNVARGGVVDQAALIEALAARSIAGAGLDVFEEEPLAPESPLWRLDNVILAPHVGGAGSRAGTDRVIALARENLERFRSGRELLNRVAL
ncbi:MAG TPA: D-2-hydroxyacid dehydrogenase [Candidatus Binatia bacterium]|nr:D-2-hydroxyacid dehydrogenase [Candidatus Binatia bacterium]